jgi:CDP-diacylglycerol--glycerol-3-phosphate 3-phosphatidyltransferase
MISVYQIKPAFQRLLQPLLKLLYSKGISANQLTISAIVLSAGIGSCIYFSNRFSALLLIVPLGYLLRMALNALDGMMATQYNMKSKLGEILNELGDVVSDACIILPLMVIPGIHMVVVIVFALLSIINEFAGVMGKVVGQQRQYDGPMGKSDRALLIGLFCILYYLWPGIAAYANWIFSVGALAVVFSTYIRIKKAIT